MTIHRWTQPTYVGAPVLTAPPLAPVVGPSGATYNFINVTSGGVGAGGSSSADTFKGAGPNAGSYWVSLGEDGLSINTNRGFRALSENSDQFDDWFNKDLVRPIFTTIVVPPGPSVSAISVPVDAYLGPTGTVLSAFNTYLYLALVSFSLDEMIDSARAHVKITSITGYPVSPADPFVVGVPAVANLSSSISPGTYYLYHGTRSSLAQFANDANYPKLAGTPHRVPWDVQNTLSRLQRSDAVVSWSSTWASTIKDLRERGLDGVYRNSSGAILPSPVVPTPIAYYDDNGLGLNNFDKAGTGAVYERNGPAMLGFSRSRLNNNASYNAFWDPVGALWVAAGYDNDPGNGGNYRPLASSRGFVSVGHNRRAGNNKTFNGTNTYSPLLSHFTALVDHRDEFSSPASQFTKISENAACFLLWTGSAARVRLPNVAVNWFCKTVLGTRRSSLVRHHTMLEIEWADASDPNDVNSRRRTYIIDSFDAVDNAIVYVRGVGGDTPNFPLVEQAAAVARVFTPNWAVLDGFEEARAYYQSSTIAVGAPRGSMFSLELPDSSGDVADNVARGTGRGSYFGAYENTSARVALSWGGYISDVNDLNGGTYQASGELYGDGSLLARNGTFITLTVTGLATLGDITTDDIACDDITCDDIVADDIQCDTLQAATSVSTYDLGVNNDAIIAGDLATTRHERLEVVLTVAVAGSQLLDLTASIETKDFIRILCQASGIVFSPIAMLLTSVNSRRKIDVIFVHDGGNAQIFTGAWPADILFENDADRYLSDEDGYVDHYTFTTVAFGSTRKALASVRRYIFL